MMEKEKAENNRQREVEVRTLSSNLGTLRLDNETLKRKMREMENNTSQQKLRYDGELKQGGQNSVS